MRGWSIQLVGASTPHYLSRGGWAHTLEDPLLMIWDSKEEAEQQAVQLALRRSENPATIGELEVMEV